LIEERNRADKMIEIIDKTIKHIIGEITFLEIIYAKHVYLAN